MEDFVRQKKQVDTVIETFLTNKQTMTEWFQTYTNMDQNKEMLDSFFFQLKIVKAEYELIERLYQMIDNRMYGEYYKLWVSMNQYSKELLKEETRRFPTYKDLEPMKQYDFELVESIYKEILTLFQKFQRYIEKKQKEIDVHKQQLDKGIHIENYINVLTYQIGLIQDQVQLFNNSFQSFNSYHKNRYVNLIQKIELFNAQLELVPYPACECGKTATSCELCSLRSTISPCGQCQKGEAIYCSSCYNSRKLKTTQLIEPNTLQKTDDTFEFIDFSFPENKPFTPSFTTLESIPEVDTMNVAEVIDPLHQTSELAKVSEVADVANVISTDYKATSSSVDGVESTGLFNGSL